MSQKAVHEVIGRAVADQAFRDQLFKEPAAALAEYDLTGEEQEALSTLNQQELEEFAGRLDDRITKGRWLPGN